jgi:hypothetical protein
MLMLTLNVEKFKKGRGDVLLSFILVGGAWAFAFYGVLL